MIKKDTRTAHKREKVSDQGPLSVRIFTYTTNSLFVFCGIPHWIPSKISSGLKMNWPCEELYTGIERKQHGDYLFSSRLVHHMANSDGFLTPFSVFASIRAPTSTRHCTLVRLASNAATCSGVPCIRNPHRIKY